MELTSIIEKNIEKMQNQMGSRYWNISASGIWLRKILREKLEQHAEGKLLDAGSGNLLYKDFLTPFSQSYRSLDLDDHPELNYHQDIQDMDLESKSFDTVFCRNVLEHVKKPEKALSEISRVLEYGGKAIVSVPHLAYLHNEPEDYYRFTIYGIEELSKDTELEIIDVQEAGGLFSFLGYIFSTALMGLIFHIPIISKIGYYLNYLLQIILSKLDILTRNTHYLPLNYVIVFEKTEA